MKIQLIDGTGGHSMECISSGMLGLVPPVPGISKNLNTDGGTHMEVIEKWTVRQMPVEIVDRLREVRSVNFGLTYSVMIADAVTNWFHALPVLDEEDCLPDTV